MKDIISYAIPFGVGIAIGYIFSTQQPTASVIPVPRVSATSSVAPSSPSRWISGYHGPVDGIYPGAGVTEQLFTNINKYGTPADPSSPYQTNGNTIFVD